LANPNRFDSSSGDKVSAVIDVGEVVGTTAVLEIGALVVTIGTYDRVGELVPKLVKPDTGAVVCMAGAPETGDFDGKFVFTALEASLDVLRVGLSVSTSELTDVIDGAGVTPACASPKIETIVSNLALLSSFEVGFPQS
jgi:hypothetical protein